MTSRSEESRGGALEPAMNLPDEARDLSLAHLSVTTAGSAASPLALDCGMNLSKSSLERTSLTQGCGALGESDKDSEQDLRQSGAAMGGASFRPVFPLRPDFRIEEKMDCAYYKQSLIKVLEGSGVVCFLCFRIVIEFNVGYIDLDVVWHGN